MQRLSSLFSFNTLVLIGALLGVAAGYSQISALSSIAQLVSDIFIRLLKLVSLPLIFLSVITAIGGMRSFQEFRTLGQRVIRYTLITTLIAATVALGLFVLIDPVSSQMAVVTEQVDAANAGGYLSYLVGIIPTNVIQPFYENHVLGVLFMAVALALSILTLPEEQKRPLNQLFSSLFAAVMRATSFIIYLMPVAVWSFVTLFMIDLQGGLPVTGLMLYLACVVLANLVQAIVVLPTLLLIKGRDPVQMFKGMLPALVVAFFSKSSGVALPMAMECAEGNMGISQRVSRFSFPLCVTINMNACAAFILTTVLFVSMSHGVVFSPMELISWIFIATIAAVGNAGVPMGCYFLSTAFLVAMNVPLNIMGALLPIYTLIDMLETAINVWSDGCVAAAVDSDIKAMDQAATVTA